ncbi:hypothetical protein ACIP4Y_37555 [Streptomyces sp. NPDC088810]|uniref:hypothetical protein n=1 Tax=Streptomyces sp. NPDC088810 TaxID=3365904 RepID=UPI0038253A69
MASNVSVQPLGIWSQPAQDRLIDGQGVVAGGHVLFVEQGPSEAAVLGDAVVALKGAGDVDLDGAVLRVGDDVDAGGRGAIEAEAGAVLASAAAADLGQGGGRGAAAGGAAAAPGSHGRGVGL